MSGFIVEKLISANAVKLLYVSSLNPMPLLGISSMLSLSSNKL